MTNIPWLETDEPFPAPEQALDSPNGLLAAGGHLDTTRLLAAYRSGIFPWYEEGQPLLWWSPDPRAILKPENIKISRSLRKRLKRSEYEVCIDRDFPSVIDACAAPRLYADETWITDDMMDAYCDLHDLGHAHSIECYLDGQLVGGLYGVCVQNLFCGESMFHTHTDASKVAFVHLARFMQERGSPMIDCQLENSHLMSLGCELIPRSAYLQQLQQSLLEAPISWPQGQLSYDWSSPVMPQSPNVIGSPSPK